MYPSTEPNPVQSPAPQLCAIEPFPNRLERLDKALRDRLRTSLEHIGEVVRDNPVESEVLKSIETRLSEGQVSPWVFCLYSKLVAELSKQPRGDVAAATQEVADAAGRPAAQGILTYKGGELPSSWWDHFALLIDTDPQRRFNFAAPTPEDAARCREQIAAGLAMIEEGDPEFAEEVRELARDIVLAAPASREDGFNGASTFFFWGGILLSATAKRSPIAMVDVLVHESSHVLLFGLSAEGPLTLNNGHERYASPVRTDKRPIDGIYHAAFVTTRVHSPANQAAGSSAKSLAGIGCIPPLTQGRR